MADHDPAGAAREAAAVKAVELVAACLMVALGVLLQVAQREASDPDFAATAGHLVTAGRGRWALAAERGWASVAGYCWRRAERFRLEKEQVTGRAY